MHGGYGGPSLPARGSIVSLGSSSAAGPTVGLTRQQQQLLQQQQQQQQQPINALLIPASIASPSTGPNVQQLGMGEGATQSKRWKKY